MIRFDSIRIRFDSWFDSTRFDLIRNSTRFNSIRDSIRFDSIQFDSNSIQIWFRFDLICLNLFQKLKKFKKIRISFDQWIKINWINNRIELNLIRFDSIQIQIQFRFNSIRFKFGFDLIQNLIDRIRIEFSQIRIRFGFGLNRIESNRIWTESELNSNLRIFAEH